MRDVTRIDEPPPPIRRLEGACGAIDWSERSLIEIAVKSDEDNQATRLDYAMDECGVRRERVRRALVGYLIDERREGYTDPVSVRHLTSSL